MSILEKMKNMLSLEEELEDEIEDTISDLDLSGDNEIKGKEIKTKSNDKKVGVILIEVTEFSQSAKISDHLKKGKSIIINLQKITPETARRVVDFITGVVYAIDGTIEKVGPNIFLCVPTGIGVAGEIKDELSGNIETEEH